MYDTHMFWAYDNLGRFENLCVESFVKCGYQVVIWTYGDISNAPPKVKIRDAREVLSESEVFLNQSGSYASFSDLFRYAVLSRFGGLYSDADVIALCKPDALPASKFFVTERVLNEQNSNKNRSDVSLNNNIIFNPSPSQGDVIDLAFAYSSRFPKHLIRWSEIGPQLLSAVADIYPQHGFQIMDPDFANPINYWDCPKKLLEPNIRLGQSRTSFIHLYNEMWRRSGIDKNGFYPKGSLMDSISDVFNKNDLTFEKIFHGNHRGQEHLCF